MNNRLKALQAKYQELLGEADAIRRQYTNTAKSMTDEESTKFDTIMEEADKIEVEIDREQKALAREKSAAEIVDRPEFASTKGEVSNELIKKAQYKALNEYIKFGHQSETFLHANAELKVLQADLDTSGGYLNTPQMWVESLLKDLDNSVDIRRLSQTFAIGSSESLGVPSLDTDLNDADWTTELATGSQDDAMRFGKRELRPHPFAKRVKISNTFMRLSLIDPETLVRDRIRYKFAITEEKGFLTGTGAGQPLGIFTASAQGINTDRDVSTGNTTSAIVADNLIEVKHTLKGQYWGSATWMFHRDGMKKIRQLKDGNGQYLWQPGLAGGQPNTILDCPYVMSEYVPNTFTTGLYVGILGDFSFYWIADSLGLTIQRVNELYAESNSTGFIARAESDGMPVLPEAFVRVKLA